MLLSTGCTSHLEGTKTSISDPVGNLQGDQSRSFLDIVQVGVALQEETYAFSVQVDTAFPSVYDMTDKRLDIIWYVNIDRDLSTGQTKEGNDYNIHLFLDKNGWRSAWYKVSDKSKADGVTVAQRDFKIEVKGDKAVLSFPKLYLPSEDFEWWAFCGTLNAPKWQPKTENPHTMVSTFSIPKKP